MKAQSGNEHEQSGDPADQPTVVPNEAPSTGNAEVSGDHRSEETSADQHVQSRPTLLHRLTGTPLRLAGTALGTIFTGAVAAIIAGLVLGWFSGQNSATPSVTQQIIFQPWATGGSGGISSDVHVNSRVSGTCWTHSSITSRPDAYRCTYGNYVLDPCISSPFEGVFSDEVVCPYPGPNSVTLITLKSGLPKSSSSANAPLTPWLLTLADGENCLAFSAMTISAAGLGEDYACLDGGLYNGIHRSEQPWTIFEQRRGSSELTLVTVAKAYF
jgi:hypothetical protein